MSTPLFRQKKSVLQYCCIISTTGILVSGCRIATQHRKVKEFQNVFRNLEKSGNLIKFGCDIHENITFNHENITSTTDENLL